MSKFKVPLFGAPQRFITIDTNVTNGAVVGVNLYDQNGNLIKLADILNPEPGEEQDVYPSIWRLLLEIPPNVVAVEHLVGDGFPYMDDIGDWRLRKLGRQVIDFSYGDASPIPIYTTPHPLAVVLVRFAITTPFDGAAPSLTLGTGADPELLFPAAHVDPRTAGSYEFISDALLLANEDLIFAINPDSSSAGAGQIIIDTIPLEGA